MKVAIIGTGYVGLVSGVGLATYGHDVTCVDVRAEVITGLNRGEPHIHEADLPAMLRAVIARGRFRATTDLRAASRDTPLVLIAVGTPSEAGCIDLTYVKHAAEQVGSLLRDRREFLAAVVKSTVVPGTTDTVVRGVLETSSGRALGEFGLGMNPEFLREGSAVADFMRPDRIVLGHETPSTLALLRELYAPWACEKVEVNARTAEFIKYANNCLLATQISAVNELANLAATVGGVDIADVMRGVHLDRRWNPEDTNGRRVNPGILSYLVAGCGFGGSCFPKDLQALRSEGVARGQPMPLLQAVLDVNQAQPAQIVRLLERKFARLAGRRALVLGLAFKPGTDDVRESASLVILAELARLGVELVAHDPVAMPNARRACAHWPVEFVEDWQARLNEVEIVIVATRWPDYERLRTPELARSLEHKTIVDARRMFQPEDFCSAGYLTIGRRPVSASN